MDDGYRNAAEFLRARLRISIGEARRRLALAPDVLPQAGMAGQEIPARREALAEALSSALVPSRSATIISTALDKVRQLTDDGTITRMEHALTATAIESDPDFVTTIAKRWVDSIDQDGPEPSEEVLRQLQGAFLRRRRRHGLHHIEIFATAEQYETLATAMNTATNPRLTGHNGEPGTAPDSSTGNSTSTSTHDGTATALHRGPDTRSGGPDLDRRTRAQKLLNGLVGACAVAMTTGKLPSNGGLRPQLAVTIDERDLFERLTRTAPTPSTATPAGAAPTPPGTAATQTTGPDQQNPRPRTAATQTTGTGPDPHHSRLSSGTATFTGPMHPNTIRKIACDADILPVLLGTASRILDIGRTTRIFPPHIRKAITARDQGCAFPDCTMPAPWCEAHHITYWSHGGTTSTDNGTLLCSHHHHLIQKENWTITTTTGVPWFTPPPHIDPKQTPRRNHHHTPLRT
ncbi:HNH endonuclease [Paenarthrobacter sp. MMS21-TAE1-1]|uniref:HNH endonuclease n=1 Tax=Paenarthrobacter aromaticivorans TaxID=2849150 RepID=A0ABS6I9U1_9MICC|nr:HNH endonuclease [Paenarthrobacter sp. MMS21-TAE1-1]